MRGQHHAPAALYPQGNTRYLLYRRLGGPQGRSGQVRKISPPPGFDPRIVQPIASRYIDKPHQGLVVIICTICCLIKKLRILAQNAFVVIVKQLLTL